MSDAEALQYLLQRHRRSTVMNDFIRICLAVDKDTGVLGPNPIVRKKTLEIKGGNDTLQIQLTGHAFQNVAASPSIVELAIQRWSSASAPGPLLVTNDTDSQLESLAVTVTGNFTEDHSGCVNVKPGDSCFIYVTYPPKQSAAAQGSLAFSGTLAATPAGPKPPETQTNQNLNPPEKAAQGTNPAPPKNQPFRDASDFSALRLFLFRPKTAANEHPEKAVAQTFVTGSHGTLDCSSKLGLAS